MQACICCGGQLKTLHSLFWFIPLLARSFGRRSQSHENGVGTRSRQVTRTGLVLGLLGGLRNFAADLGGMPVVPFTNDPRARAFGSRAYHNLFRPYSFAL